MALRIPLLPRPLRWVQTVLVAGMICYGSILATPTALPLPLATLGGPTDTVAASWLGPFLEGAMPPSHRRHALAYATLTLSLAYAVADRDLPIVEKALLVFAVAMTYGIAMEVGQLFRPERTAALADVAVNALGAAVALQWYALERRARFVPLRELRRARLPTRG